MSAKVTTEQTDNPTAPSPYLEARRAWDERYGDLITRARNWRLAAVLALLVLGMAVIGMVVMSGRAHVIPYVVAVDSLGRVVAQGNAAEGVVADDRMKRAALYEWLVSLRMVSTDRFVERAAIDKTYAMIAGGSQAQSYISAYFRDHSPFAQAELGSVTVEVKSILAISGQTYEVEWIEKTIDVSGESKGPGKRMKGSFVVVVNPPRDETLTRLNPLGIYVTNANWAEEL